MNTKIIIVPPKLQETEFLDYMFKTYGVNGLKFVKSNIQEIRNTLLQLEDYNDRWSSYAELSSCFFKMFESGKPDFFLYNRKKILLCEFKSLGDTLSANQMLWFNKYNFLPTAIAIAVKPSIVQKDQSIDEAEITGFA